MRTDVVVIGGGPAGLYAAQHLARAGLAVHVLEEHGRVGDPVHCTGILSTEALSLPGVPSDVVLGRPHVARFHSPFGHEFAYPGTEGEVCVIDRGSFDRCLAERATAEGAEIVVGARAIGMRLGNGCVDVDAKIHERAETVSAAVCVVACGASYRFQRSLGWGMPPLFLGSAQTEVCRAPGEEVSVFLRRDLLPAGFGWLAPMRRELEPRAKVGVMATSGARRALSALLEDLRAAGRVLPVGVGAVITRLLPLAPLARTYGNRVLAVGDAAGLVKPTTGGGIYYSLLSARWAADTITKAFRLGQFSASVLREYEERWRARLGRELRVGMWFRRLAARLTPGDIDTLTRLAADEAFLPLIREAARFNWHHELILRAACHPAVMRLLVPRLLSRGEGGTEPPAWRLGVASGVAP